jgi:hypothetical protein
MKERKEIGVHGMRVKTGVKAGNATPSSPLSFGAACGG